MSITNTASELVSYIGPQAGSVTLTAQTKLSDFLNVQDLGAVGDGATDDLAKFQSFGTFTDRVRMIGSGDYYLSSQWRPAAQDITMLVNGDVEFSNSLPNLDLIIPYQDIAGPVWSQLLVRKNYGSAWNGMGNIFQIGSFARSEIANSPVVAVFGEGEAVTDVNSKVWGGNFVAYSNVSGGGVAIATELNCGVLTPGGQAYGLVIASAGQAAQANNAIQIQTNEVQAQFIDGINFQFGPVVGGITGSLIKISGSSSTCNKFIEGFSIQATQAEIDLPSFQVGATPVSPANRVKVSAGTSGNAATLETIGEANAPLTIKAAGSGDITLGASSSQTILSPSSIKVGGSLPGSPNILLGQDGRSLFTTSGTIGADSPTLEVRRLTTHSGGTPGYVNFALKATTTVQAGVSDYEWAVLAQIDNYATAADNGENSAFYAQAKKRSTGKTWAGALEIIDYDLSSPAVGDTIGLEIAGVTPGNTSDTNSVRAMIHSVVKSSDANFTEWARGIWHDSEGVSQTRECFSNSSRFTKAVFFNNGVGTPTATDPNPTLLRDNGSGTYGIDLTRATYSSGQAVRLGGTSGSPNVILATNGTISAVNTTIQPIASERRLKENIVPVDPASSWETVKQTPLYSYNFLGHDTVSYGPIADEVPQEMVVETDQSDEEGVIRTYDNGMLHARMYVALQEALKRIESLESELASLKNPN